MLDAVSTRWPKRAATTTPANHTTNPISKAYAVLVITVVMAVRQENGGTCHPSASELDKPHSGIGRLPR
jgi:hypothetical protein